MLKQIFGKPRELLRSPFTRNVGSMMMFTAVGQSVYLLSGPLIGRIFSPSEFGLYGLFYTFAITAVGVIFLNFDFAVPAAATDEEARDLTWGAAAIAAVFIPLSGAVMAGFSFWNIAGFGTLPLTAALLLCAVLAAQAAIQLLQNWRIRWHETIIIGKASITLNLIRGVTQIAMGLMLPTWWSLAAGEVLGRIGNVIHLAPKRRSTWRERNKASRRRVMAVLHHYRQFPIVLLPAQLTDSVVTFIQSAGLAYLFGTAGLGMFFLMRRTLDIPVAFVFRSLSDVFYARLAHDARTAPERVRPFFVRSVLLIAGFGMLAAIPFMMISPALFALIFGPEWREAGILAAIMAPAVLMNLAVAPVARIFALTDRPQLRFCFSLTNVIGTILALAAAKYWSLDLVYATAMLSAATFTAYVAYFIAGYVASAALRSGSASAIPQS